MNKRKIKKKSKKSGSWLIGSGGCYGGFWKDPIIVISNKRLGIPQRDYLNYGEVWNYHASHCSGVDNTSIATIL